MKSMMEFPIKHIEGNLLFGRDGTVWAYYRVEGFGYDFRETEEKMIPFQQQLSFLANNGHDLHFVVSPSPTDTGAVLDETIQAMQHLSYPLKESGIAFMEQLKDVLIKQRQINETSEYYHYLGMQLNPEKNKYKEGNAGTNALDALQKFLIGFKSPVYRAMGLEPYDILQEEIDAWKEQAESLITTVSGGFSSAVKPISAKEAVYLAEKVFAVTNSNHDVKHRPDFAPGEYVEGLEENGDIHKAMRPDEPAFLDLQSASVEEVGPKTLLMKKIIENDVEEMYVQYLVCDSMDEVNHHPGFEWLYKIQAKMPFPVGVSIRAYHQHNTQVRKKLSNARLEFEDQRQEATKGGTGVDLSVSTSEQGAIQMENYFKRSGQPAYSCSFVFRVNAKDQKTLKSRADSLRNELSRYGVSVLAPYGEQLQLAMETIPGSKQYHTDYKIEAAPGILAGAMFGATTNIGDNRGLFIGYTKQFKRPVFIKPDLAAKAFEGVHNVVDSISVLVAGMTGKGKSVFMNLFTYLSVLSGSQALILDPKGDRKGWEKGLPFIPKEHVSLWTLGRSQKDAGCLDPFRTSTNIEEAKDVCMDILSYLAGIHIQDDQYTILSEAVEEVSRTDNPCIGAVISYLHELYKKRPESMSKSRHESVERLKGTLETLRRNQLARLLFGEVGQDYRALTVDKPLQVMMVQNLTLPDAHTKQPRPAHKISEAIMISLTAFTKQYMFNQDRSRHKIILQDEARSVDRSAVGAELMNFIIRQGRYYNTTLIKGSQNASDYGDDVANIGMKFSFGMKKTSEAAEMLDYLNLPQTPANIETLKGLNRGEALFQDIYGRSAIVKINPVFKDLLEAFDSSTSTEEERKREKERVLI